MPGLDASAPRSRIFISYRRAHGDQHAAAGLARDLGEAFPSDRVFLDFTSIYPGADFEDALQQGLQTCAALLVVIGPQWLTATDRQGRRRLEQPGDWVRREVAEALRNEDVRVFPVLLDVEMPNQEDLPEDLQSLARRQGVPLTTRHWPGDVAHLVNSLKMVPGLTEAPRSRNDPVGVAQPRRQRELQSEGSAEPNAEAREAAQRRAEKEAAQERLRAAMPRLIEMKKEEEERTAAAERIRALQDREAKTEARKAEKRRKGAKQEAPATVGGKPLHAPGDPTQSLPVIEARVQGGRSNLTALRTAILLQGGCLAMLASSTGMMAGWHLEPESGSMALLFFLSILSICGVFAVGSVVFVLSLRTASKLRGAMQGFVFPLLGIVGYVSLTVILGPSQTMGWLVAVASFALLTHGMFLLRRLDRPTPASTRAGRISNAA